MSDPSQNGADELGCPRLVELVTEYLEGALSEGEQARFEEHLALCPGCVTYLEQARQTVRAVGRLPGTPVPPDVRAGLIQVYKKLRCPDGHGAGADR